jgi:hypothetical protein
MFRSKTPKNAKKTFFWQVHLLPWVGLLIG